MKKAFLLGATLLAAFSLTGCEMIENLLKGGQDLIDEKKDYKYDDFAVLIADKNFSFSFTKCTAQVEHNDKKAQSNIHTMPKINCGTIRFQTKIERKT